MKRAVRTAAVAGGILAAWVAAGCGGPSGGSAAGGPPPGTVAGCAAYGMYAIEHHITVTGNPAACRGLSRADVNQAAAMAILRVTGGAPKASWRRRAARAAPFLRNLITAPAAATGPPAAGSTWPGSGTRASGTLGGRDMAMDTAALLAWLVTAASGAYVLGRWIAGGGTLRQRADATGSPPEVVVAHFGLALAGLMIWVGYLIAGWVALAWTAVGVLLPVAGLGMATVAVGLPGRAPAGAAAGFGGAAGADGVSPVPGRRFLAPLAAVGHGLVAASTIMLVLLAALGTSAS